MPLQNQPQPLGRPEPDPRLRRHRGRPAEPAGVEAQEPWHALPAPEVVQRLESSEAGLSAEEAARRLQRWGPNTLAIAPPISPWKILVAQTKSLVVGLLFGAAVLALAAGDIVESVSIFVVLLVNVALGFFTELGARQAMEGLRKLQVPTARVRRDGQELTVPAAELVPGDLLVLEEGAAVAADARLLQAADLRTLEAPLTGEPYPVSKQAEAVEAATLLADRTSMVYQGTLVARGHGLAVVTGTGAATEVGTITDLVRKTEVEKTPLEQRLDALGRRMIWLTLSLAAVVAVVGIARGGSWWLMVETGLALAIAAVPEGLPVVATITLAVGMHRMARRRALVRRLPAVETLGSATVVCTDKTGTLTAGEMTVTRLVTAEDEVEITGAGYAAAGELQRNGQALEDPTTVPGLEEALCAAVLANRARVDAEGVVHGDPTEAALLIAARKAGVDRADLLSIFPETGELPFSSERMLMATFHHREAQEAQGAQEAQEAQEARTLVCVKGAPGRVLDLCGRQLTAAGEQLLEPEERQRLLDANEALATEGLRVLALAQRRLPAGSPPPSQPVHDAAVEKEVLQDLTFLALAAISDPPADGVADTIRLLHEAGVRTVMLTGDQRATATAVAEQLGLLGPDDELLGGSDLTGLSAAELARRLPRIGAFSRVSPADKLSIVDAFHERGEIVAMLGDGVNDAPALKKADIGVAMGGRGTDAAKDAASVVLADDRFQTIAAAVEEGRVIFDNIRKFIFYLFSCNLAEVLVLLLSVLGGLPLPLLPLQILWLNLVTDVFPALALGLEPAEPDVMGRPPRDPQAEILSRRFLLQVLTYGLLLTAVPLITFQWALHIWSLELAHARTIAFMTLALTQLFHVFNARSPRAVLFNRRLFQNPWAWGAIALTIGLQLAVLYLPPLRQIFDTTPLGPQEWALVLIASLLPLILGQGAKGLRRRSD
ncbi:MAG: HAD-IC family P-type ATPase [Acidobacteriota bacterium]|nr:HAD-IC family P-type ATPase [Acidobacteriota bacterium]